MLIVINPKRHNLCKAIFINTKRMLPQQTGKAENLDFPVTRVIIFAKFLSGEFSAVLYSFTATYVHC